LTPVVYTAQRGVGFSFSAGLCMSSVFNSKAAIEGWPCLFDARAVLMDIAAELLDRVWRIVTIQSKPYEYSDTMADKLKSELWKTALTH
jgi:hypothetical protein